jgi:hypothetical protein
MLVLPVPMIAVLALSLAVARHRVLALCLLPLILAAGTYLRRFGPAASASGHCCLAAICSGSCWGR